VVKSRDDSPKVWIEKGFGDDLADENVFAHLRGGIEEVRRERDRGVDITPFLIMIPLVIFLWGGATFFADNRAELASPLPVSSANLSGETGFEAGIGGGPAESTPSASPSPSVENDHLLEVDSATKEL